MLDAKDKVLEYAEVSPFSDEYQLIKGIPITSCATAWQSCENSEVHILVFHQSLYFGEKLNHSLLCPNQIRDNGNRGCLIGTHLMGLQLQQVEDYHPCSCL